MDSSVTSAYMVIPSGLPMIRSYQAKGGYSEKIIFENQAAWLVEADLLRGVQRGWSLRKHGRGSIQRAFELIQLAGMLLDQPIPNRRRRNGEPAKQWGLRFRREELARLRVLLSYWIERQVDDNVRGELRVTYNFLDLDFMLGRKPSAEELSLTKFTGDSVIPIKTLSYEGCTATVVLPEIPHECDQTVPRSTMPCAMGKRVAGIDLVVQEAWSYLPPKGEAKCGKGRMISVPESLLMISPSSVCYPDPSKIERAKGGGAPVPEWLRDSSAPNFRPLDRGTG